MSRGFKEKANNTVEMENTVETTENGETQEVMVPKQKKSFWRNPIVQLVGVGALSYFGGLGTGKLIWGRKKQDHNYEDDLDYVDTRYLNDGASDSED